MRKSQNNQLFNIGKAGALALLVFAILSLILCAVLLKKELSSNLYFPLLLSAAGVSGLFGGASATRKERKNGLLNGALAAVLPISAYLIATAVLQRRFAWSSLLPCLVLLIGSVAAGVVAANRTVKAKNKKRK